jgi:hypothetical protein
MNIRLAPPRSSAQTQTSNYNACAITSTAATTCYGVPGAPTAASYVLGFFNGASVAQTATVQCTDGVFSFTIGALGATQVVTLPTPGFPVTYAHQLVCTASSTPAGPIYVLVR